MPKLVDRARPDAQLVPYLETRKPYREEGKPELAWAALTLERGKDRFWVFKVGADGTVTVFEDSLRTLGFKLPCIVIDEGREQPLHSIYIAAMEVIRLIHARGDEHQSEEGMVAVSALEAALADYEREVSCG